MHTQKEWTLTGLRRAQLKDLAECHTETERGCCEAINSMEIRERADELSAKRKLTPGEVAIAQAAGWKAL